MKQLVNTVRIERGGKLYEAGEHIRPFSDLKPFDGRFYAVVEVDDPPQPEIEVAPEISSDLGTQPEPSGLVAPPPDIPEGDPAFDGGEAIPATEGEPVATVARAGKSRKKKIAEDNSGIA